ncbi:MAG: hypothetical protein ACYT04_39315, partial [Nostoc sp.]
SESSSVTARLLYETLRQRHRCLFYAHNPYLVCAVHLDFVPELPRKDGKRSLSRFPLRTDIALNLNQNFATVRCPDEVNIAALVIWIILNVLDAHCFWFGAKPSLNISSSKVCYF